MRGLNLFDHYSLRARLQPALLTLLPGAVGLFSLSGSILKWQSALWTLFGTVGGTFFLGILARNAGKRLEIKLWQDWHGCPTTQYLRHGGVGNPVLRERWHAKLAKMLGKTFPTPDEQSNNPKGADDIYEAAAKLVIGKTRDTKKYHLLYKENVQYGYCRNLLALKPLGVVLCLASLTLSVATGLHRRGDQDLQFIPWVCASIDILFLFWWTFVIRPHWVKIPAFAYAERLMECVESLPQNNHRPPDEKSNAKVSKAKVRKKKESIQEESGAR